MPKTLARSLAAGVLLGVALFAAPPAVAEAPESSAPATTPAPDTAASLPPEEVEAMERVVRDYLLKHPEVIIEALQVLEAREAQAAAQAQRQAVAEHRDALLRDPSAPVAGNPDGAVTVVEFFDYQCPYCKSVAEPMMETVEADGDVRIVFKEFPILGPASDFAAKAALAAHRQGKYLEFHLALMAAKGKLSETAVLDIAERSGLDLERLKADMEAPEIAEALQRNRVLAAALQVSGTPAFVIGNEVIPGAIDMEQMRRYIDANRGS